MRIDFSTCSRRGSRRRIPIDRCQSAPCGACERGDATKVGALGVLTQIAAENTLLRRVRAPTNECDLLGPCFHFATSHICCLKKECRSAVAVCRGMVERGAALAIGFARVGPGREQ